MTEPVRLLQGGLSDLERELLLSARGDRPAPDARHRTVVALGMASGALAVSSGVAKALAASPMASKTAASGLMASAAAKTAGPVTAIVLAKWVAAGTVVGVVALGSLSALVRSAEPDPAPRARTVAAAAPASRARDLEVAVPARVEAEEEAPAEPDLVPPPEPERAPAAAPRRAVSIPAMTAERRRVEIAAPAEAPPQPEASEEPTSNVLEEVASLDAARRALSSGNAAGAVSRLVAHESRYRGGALAPEARVLRIRALLAAGRRAEAERLGSQFLAANPNSPHAARIRALLSSR